MDLDQINERIERLRALRIVVQEAEEEARALDVELDEGSITYALGVAEGAAAMLEQADRDALEWVYRKMVL